jgi:hypothetical protein
MRAAGRAEARREQTPAPGEAKGNGAYVLSALRGRKA